MDWQMLAPFLTATLLLMVTPDSIVAIVTHNTLRRGAKAGLMTALGVECGELIVLSAVFSGLVLSQEFLPALFRWFSLAGIAYLIWMALRTLSFPRAASSHKATARPSRPFVEGMTIA